MARLLDQKATRAIDELVKAQALQACLQFFAGEKQWINERHIELCRIPAPTFLEERRAEWMAAQFAALGWHVEADGAGNVIARPDAARTGPYIALTAHLDTVLSPRNPEDIKVAGHDAARVSLKFTEALPDGTSVQRAARFYGIVDGGKIWVVRCLGPTDGSAEPAFDEIVASLELG